MSSSDKGRTVLVTGATGSAAVRHGYPYVVNPDD
jgi:hypothetical protein